MSLVHDQDSGFSEGNIYFARQTFFRDCPNGRCSKQRFLTFIRRSSLHKTIQTNTNIIKILQDNYHSKKFFSMMFDIYDRNHDGELDFDEYIYALSAITGANQLRTIETLFNFFDIHNQGYITREGFNSRKKLAAKFFSQYQTGINDRISYEEAFNSMDLDKDGRIIKEEFFQWHLKDQLVSEDIESVQRRTRVLRNLSSLVDLQEEIKTSSLQDPLDVWLERTISINSSQQLSEAIKANGYLSKIFRRRKSLNDDSQSASDVFTSSSEINLTSNDFDSKSLLDIDEDNFQSIPSDDAENDLLCQSLKDVLMEIFIQLKQQLKNNNRNSSTKENQEAVVSRL